MARKRSDFAWSPVRRLMRSAGAEIVSRQAVQVLMDFLVLRAKNLTEVSIALAKHAKRKKVSQKDMALAIDSL